MNNSIAVTIILIVIASLTAVGTETEIPKEGKATRRELNAI